MLQKKSYTGRNFGFAQAKYRQILQAFSLCTTGLIVCFVLCVFRRTIDSSWHKETGPLQLAPGPRYQATVDVHTSISTFVANNNEILFCIQNKSATTQRTFTAPAIDRRRAFKQVFGLLAKSFLFSLPINTMNAFKYQNRSFFVFPLMWTKIFSFWYFFLLFLFPNYKWQNFKNCPVTFLILISWFFSFSYKKLKTDCEVVLKASNLAIWPVYRK